MSNTILTSLSYDLIRKYYASGHWQDDSLYCIARERAQADPQRVALEDSTRQVTYGELLQAVDMLALDFSKKKLRRGQRVAVWLSSRLETAVVVLACSRNGLVCCPSLHRNHTAQETLDLMSRMNASAFVGEEGYGANHELLDIFDALDQLETLRAVYKLKVPTDLRHLAIHTTAGCDVLKDRLIESDSMSEEFLVRDANAVCYLAFTSGTTGEPKGVMHSSNTLLANARTMAKDWAFNENSVVYTLSPLSHNLGFGAMILSILVGGKLVVHDLKRETSLLQRLIDVGATFAFGVPVHASDLLRELEVAQSADGLTLSGFRISGAAAPAALVAKLLDYGIRPQSGYGMTEGCSHHYTLPDDSPERVINTSGRACSGYEIQIVSPDNPNLEVSPGVVGQIVARGASLMLGYFDNQRATETSYNDHGWFMTGDLGYVDEAGYITITGRKKDVIIRGGHNIFPAKIEALTHRFNGVERVAAIPVADERLGEKVCLVIMPREGALIDHQAVLQHLYESGLSKFDMPEYLLIVKEIPLTASGKILKRALVDSVNSGQLSPEPVRWVAGS